MLADVDVVRASWAYGKGLTRGLDGTGRGIISLRSASSHNQRQRCRRDRSSPELRFSVSPTLSYLPSFHRSPDAYRHLGFFVATTTITTIVIAIIKVFLPFFQFTVFLLVPFIRQPFRRRSRETEDGSKNGSPRVTCSRGEHPSKASGVCRAEICQKKRQFSFFAR